MIGNHKDTNKYPINLLIVNYLHNFFYHPYNSFLSIFKQLLNFQKEICLIYYTTYKDAVFINIQHHINPNWDKMSFSTKAHIKLPTM